METTKTEIRQFIVQHFLFGQDDGLTDDTSFLQEGIIDSTGVLELVAHLEKSHGIKVADEELTPENLDSINAIAAFVDRKRSTGISQASTEPR